MFIGFDEVTEEEILSKITHLISYHKKIKHSLFFYVNNLERNELRSQFVADQISREQHGISRAIWNIGFVRN